MFIKQFPLDHVNFFPPYVDVGFKLLARGPAHQGYRFTLNFVQGHDFKPAIARHPPGLVGIYTDVFKVTGPELV